MRKLALSALTSLSYLSFTPLAHAQTITPVIVDPCANAGTFTEICKLGSSEGLSIGGVLGTFVSIIFAVAAIIAVIYLIFGGIKWITSRGEKTEVEAARNHIIAALVGLIMVFLAFFLINFVLGFFIQGFNLTNIELPSLDKK